MRRTPAENINLPPALLSRFDIMWLILDRADIDSDLALARHVLHVHRHAAPPALDFQPLESSVLRAYVAAAREVVPFVPRDLTDYIATAYSSLRQEEASEEAPPSYTTARTLLSIIRLSEVCSTPFLLWFPCLCTQAQDSGLAFSGAPCTSLLFRRQVVQGPCLQAGRAHVWCTSEDWTQCAWRQPQGLQNEVLVCASRGRFCSPWPGCGSPPKWRRATWTRPCG